MQVTIRDRGDLKAIARDIRKATNAGQLRKELSRGIRAELKPLVPRVRAAYGGGEHLRPALRKATRVEVKLSGRQAGARIRVDGRRMPDGMGSLPAMYEGDKRWRHPVWGNREVWVTQMPHPTFYRVVRPWEGIIRRRIEKIAEQVVAKIAKG